MKCICHRCGRVLSSEQALAYHLNKTINCKTLLCNTCNIYFTSKTKYDTHVCISQRKQIRVKRNENGEVRQEVKGQRYDREHQSWP